MSGTCHHCTGPMEPKQGKRYCSRRCKENAREERQRRGRVVHCELCSDPLPYGRGAPRRFCTACAPLGHARTQRLQEVTRGRREGRPIGLDLRMRLVTEQITPHMAGGYKRSMALDPCTYCGAPSTGHDHITPSSARGDNEWTNLTGCCPSCNSSKQTHSMLHHLLAQRIRADIDRSLAHLAAVTGNAYERGIGDLTRGRGK